MKYLQAFLSFGLALVRAVLTLTFVACVVSRFMLKDHFSTLAFWYYATPLPILIVIAFLLAVLQAWAQHARARNFYIASALVLLFIWTYESFGWHHPVRVPDEVKVFCWNAASNPRAEEISRYVAAFDADVIGIVEAGIRTSRVATWQRAFPQYHVEKLAGNMAVLTTGEVLTRTMGSLGGRGRYSLLEIALRGKRIQVLLVDFDSDPFRSRAPAFVPLLDLIRRHAQENLIVMGDFNTPYDSFYFEAFRPYLQHAFAQGGTGFAQTWPLPVPMLEIDHIWVSKPIHVVDCRMDWSDFSDHRPVVANLALPLPAMSAYFTAKVASAF